jgi:hypothetical protein
VPDSERLQQLRRQRELAAEQLAWLYREIAAVSGAPASAPAEPPLVRPVMTPTVPAAAPVPAAPELTPKAAADAEAILAQYRVEPDSMKSDVKKGCFLYFFAALAVVALVVVVLYVIFRHGK